MVIFDNADRKEYHLIVFRFLYFIIHREMDIIR